MRIWQKRMYVINKNQKLLNASQTVTIKTIPSKRSKQQNSARRNILFHHSRNITGYFCIILTPLHKHSSAYISFCCDQTHDILHGDSPLHEYTRSCKYSADIYTSKYTGFNVSLTSPPVCSRLRNRSLSNMRCSPNFS